MVAIGSGLARMKISSIPLGKQPARVEILDEDKGRGVISINFILRINPIRVT